MIARFFSLLILCAFSIISCDSDSTDVQDDKSALVFTVDDILFGQIEFVSGYQCDYVRVSIVFTDIIYEKIISGDYDRLIFYNDNEPLWENIQLKWQWEVIPYDYIVLSGRNGGVDWQDYRFRLINSTQKFEVEWNVFIKCLNDAGKIVH